MIELTKKQFDTFLSTFNIAARMSHLVIAKVWMQQNPRQANYLANMQQSSFNDILVFTEEAFYYNSPTQAQCFARIGQGVSYNGSGSMILTSSINRNQSMYVVYVLADNADSSTLFSNVDLVTVDYVGQDVRQLSFNKADGYANLEEINLYSGGRMGITGLYDGIRLDDGQYVYNGVLYGDEGDNNFMEFELTPGAFKGSKIKKLILPAGVHVPDSLCEGCTSLLEVAMASNRIGKSAFSGCTNLQSFYTSTGVDYIGEGAFNGCINLMDIHMTYYTPSVGGTNYFGIRGCVIKAEGISNDKVKLSIFFANNNWWDGIANHITECGYVHSFKALSLDKLYPSSNLKSPNNLYPEVNMYCTDAPSGSYDSVYDIINDETADNVVLVTAANINSIKSYIHSLNPADVIYDRFYMPICYFISEIMPNACANNTTITTVNLDMFRSLVKIDNSAFSGCSNITTLVLPPKYDASTTASYTAYTNEALTLGTSAFEKCTSITDLSITKETSYSSKTFFGCSSLAHVDFGNYPPVFGETSAPDLCFGSTPSLASITCNIKNKSVAYNGSTALNAIVGTDGTNFNGRILVGCKNTNFQALKTSATYGCDIIGPKALYGCTSLVINGNNQKLSGYRIIENSAFYGCVGIVSTSSAPVDLNNVTQMHDSAFYACTNFESYNVFNGTAATVTIGSKAFGNSGLKYVIVGSQPYISSIADDAFDGCTLVSVQILNHSSSQVSDSSTTVENSVLKKSSSNSSQLAMLKSGDGKNIVNTVYTGKNVTEIKSNAFTGVKLASGNNTAIRLPKSVNIIGKNIMSKSVLNNIPGSLGTLTLDGDEIETSGIMNTADSWGLLYYVGGRYFYKLVNDTLNYRGLSSTYYCIEHADGVIGIVIKEFSSDGVLPILQVGYVNNQIVLEIDAVPDQYYNMGDYHSHATQLEEPMTLVLMDYEQVYTSEDESVYCDSRLSAGTRWGGIVGVETDMTVPNDITYVNRNPSYPTYQSDGGSFSDCTWVRKVTINRNIDTLVDGFSNCTALEKAEYMASNGVIPNGMFSGCTNFTQITPDKAPANFGKSSFKGCGQLDARFGEYLSLGSLFDEESFANSNLTEINLVSAETINPKAFQSCHLTSAKADSTKGYYFTGAGGDCIIDAYGNIVVGTPNVEITSDITGINEYAFYGRVSQTSWEVTPTDKNNFEIGQSAFSTSDITSYYESNCSGTEIAEEAFSNCKSLTTVTLGGTNGAPKLSKKSFSGCSNLVTLNFPSATEVPVSCFNNCTSLTSVSLGSGVDDEAFANCTSLATVQFTHPSSTLAIIEPSAFKSCPITAFSSTNQSTAIYNFTANTVSKVNSDNHLELVLGTQTFAMNEMDGYQDLKVIGKHAYNGRGLVGEIIIPGSVVKIDDYAFANNPELTYVHIPPTVKYIGNHAFDGCTNLSRFTIPSEVEYMGAGVLNGCSLAKGMNSNYEDPRNLDDAQRSAITTSFPAVEQCDSVLDLRNLPFSSISASAFQQTQIKLVHLNEINTSTYSIGSMAFKDCIYLSEIHFYIHGVANGTPMLGNQAFYGCTYLSDIYIHNYQMVGVPGLSGQNVLEDVGYNVPSSRKHIHILKNASTLYPANYKDFCLSNFISTLVNTLGFTLVDDIE